MAVSIISDAVELQIDKPQPGFGRLTAEFFALRELDAIRGCLYAGVPNLSGVRNGVDEIRRHRRLATGKLNGHLPARFYREGVVHDFLDLIPRQFMDVTDLVRIHETWIAHHVAAIRQINCQNRSASVLNGAAAVVVKALVGMRRNIAA